MLHNTKEDFEQYHGNDLSMIILLYQVMNTFYRFDSTISVVNLYLQHSMSCHEFCDLLRVSVMLYNIRKWGQPHYQSIGHEYPQNYPICLFPANSIQQFISRDLQDVSFILSLYLKRSCFYFCHIWIHGFLGHLHGSAMPQTLNIATFFRQQEQSNDNLR